MSLQLDGYRKPSCGGPAYLVFPGAEREWTRVREWKSARRSGSWYTFGHSQPEVRLLREYLLMPRRCPHSRRAKSTAARIARTLSHVSPLLNHMPTGHSSANIIASI